MKKVRMNISHSRFILFKLKIFGEIVTTIVFSLLHNKLKIETGNLMGEIYGLQ